MKHPIIDRFQPFLRLLAALLIALASGALLIAVIQQDASAPIAAYRALFTGAFGSPLGLANTLRLTTPLLLTGTAVLVALAAGRFNIGAEGQMAVGALAAAVVGAIPGVPGFVLLPLAILAGSAGGAFWAVLPAYLRERRGVHEVMTSLLLNYVAQNITHYFANGPLKDPTGQAPQTAEITVFLPRILPTYDVHYGLALALFVTVTTVFALYRTAWGYETRTVGLGHEAGDASGVAAVRTRICAFVLSGALSGMAGAILILGEVPFRRFAADFYGIGYGFDGLAVALLIAGVQFPASLRNGFGILPSAFLFGALSAGAEAMAFDTSTPKQVVTIVQAIMIVAIAANPIRMRLFRKGG